MVPELRRVRCCASVPDSDAAILAKCCTNGCGEVDGGAVASDCDSFCGGNCSNSVFCDVVVAPLIMLLACSDNPVADATAAGGGEATAGACQPNES